MSEKQSQPYQPSRLSLPIRKFFLTLFVVTTFAGYAIHEHTSGASNSDSATVGLPGNDQATVLVKPAVSVQAQPSVNAVPTTSSSQSAAQRPQSQSVQPDPPTVTILPPTTVPSTPTNIPRPASGYRDGTYTGSTADAYYGLVSVQTVIQNGRIVDVQFLQYPSDRRTSVRINNVAIPRLKTEAIQAQNAHVNIISGATLTSEAFIQSFQSALDQAKS